MTIRSFSYLPCFFFFNDTATTEIYTLSLHDALPISWVRSTDLPVMAERINHAAQMPPIRVLHGGDLSGTRRQCLREHRVRIRHGEDHPNRPTAQRLRTEVVMLGRLISHPELRAVHGQPSHDPTVGSLHTVDLDRPECRLV